MHLKSRVTLGVATAAAAIGAALIPATSAFAAPAVTVTWAGQAQGFGVQSGDSVSVAGSGFKASSPVYVVECSNVTAASNCDLATAKVGQTDANGAFTVALPVHTGAVGDGTCGAGSQCYAVASTDQSGTDTSQAGANTFQFDRLQVSPRTGLKNGQQVTITGGGYKPSTPSAPTTVYVSECTGADPTKATQDCQTTSPVLQTFTADDTGAFGPVAYTVYTGKVNADGSKCDAGKSCIIAGSDNILNPANGHIGGAVVQFAQLKALSVTAKASASHVAAGAKFKIKGKATSGGAGVKGLSVVLDKMKGGVPSKVAAGKTGTGGAYAFTGLHQKKTTKYIVVISSQKGYKSAVSKTVKVSTP